MEDTKLTKESFVKMPWNESGKCRQDWEEKPAPLTGKEYKYDFNLAKYIQSRIYN